jgi:hypothetical protein
LPETLRGGGRFHRRREFFDYDNDGNADAFMVTGHPDDKVNERFSMVQFKEKPLLWLNNGMGGYGHMYENVSPPSGPVCKTGIKS